MFSYFQTLVSCQVQDCRSSVMSQVDKQAAKPRRRAVPGWRKWTDKETLMLIGIWEDEVIKQKLEKNVRGTYRKISELLKDV